MFSALVSACSLFCPCSKPIKETVKYDTAISYDYKRTESKFRAIPKMVLDRDFNLLAWDLDTTINIEKEINGKQKTKPARLKAHYNKSNNILSFDLTETDFDTNRSITAQTVQTEYIETSTTPFMMWIVLLALVLVILIVLLKKKI